MTYRISYTSGRLRDPMHYAKGFVPLLAKNNDQLEQAITRHVWSPCVWAGGVRLKKNFIGSDLCVLDVDNGWRLNDCIDYLRRIGTWSMVGITKSHTPAHHRMRIIMRWAKTIEDVTQYEYNLSRFIETTAADVACRDGARFYYPCRGIVYQQNGIDVPVLTQKRAPSPPPGLPKNYDAVPPWMADELSSGVPEGRRNRSAFRFALHLKQRGVDEGHAREILAPIVSPGFTPGELGKTIWSAYRYERGG